MGPLTANRIVPFSIGIVGGAACMYLYLGTPAGTIDAASRHPSLKYGIPETHKLRYFSNFVSELDYRTKNPAWVIEHLDEGQTRSKVASRKSPGARYHEDDEIDPRFRGLLSQYRQSGYDRGHMSPAMNNKNSDRAMAESFVLSNMAPQVGKGFNRDYWARFERFINDTVVPACGNVYVVTGPLYLENSGTEIPVGAALVPYDERMASLAKKREGNKDVTSANAITKTTTKTSVSTMQVPTHFYKVILGELKRPKADGSDVVVGAFVLPNAQIHPKTPLSSFQVPIRQLELVAGINFFPKLDTSVGPTSSIRGDVCSLNGCKLPPEQFWLMSEKSEIPAGR